MFENNSQAEENTDEVLQWVTFQLENETYAINVMQVREVLRYTDIALVPGAPKHVLGIINLRGNVVTVIDTRVRFNLQPANVSEHTRIIVIESAFQVIGMLVDSVAEVLYIKASEIDSTPNVGVEDNAKYIQGVCYKNEQLIILIDLNKLISKDELEDMANH